MTVSAFITTAFESGAVERVFKSRMLPPAKTSRFVPTPKVEVAFSVTVPARLVVGPV
jgi:hypothetical protein